MKTGEDGWLTFELERNRLIVFFSLQLCQINFPQLGDLRQLAAAVANEWAEDGMTVYVGAN